MSKKVDILRTRQMQEEYPAIVDDHRVDRMLDNLSNALGSISEAYFSDTDEGNINFMTDLQGLTASQRVTSMIAVVNSVIAIKKLPKASKQRVKSDFVRELIMKEAKEESEDIVALQEVAAKLNSYVPPPSMEIEVAPSKTRKPRNGRGVEDYTPSTRKPPKEVETTNGDEGFWMDTEEPMWATEEEVYIGTDTGDIIGEAKGKFTADEMNMLKDFL